jgi:hypothetical protein
MLRAGTPFSLSTARRFDALIRLTADDEPINDVATVEFIETRGEHVFPTDTVLMTAEIPINIG